MNRIESMSPRDLDARSSVEFESVSLCQGLAKQHVHAQCMISFTVPGHESETAEYLQLSCRGGLSKWGFRPVNESALSLKERVLIE